MLRKGGCFIMCNSSNFITIKTKIMAYELIRSGKKKKAKTTVRDVPKPKKRTPKRKPKKY